MGNPAPGDNRRKVGLKSGFSAKTCIHFSDHPTALPFRNGVSRASDRRIRDEIQTRIEKLKKDIEEASGEKPVFGTAPDCPPELEEKFLRQVLSCELAEKKRRHRRG